MSEQRPFYAHSLPGEPLEKRQTLEDHLKNTAELARQFAEAFGAGGAWGIGPGNDDG